MTGIDNNNPTAQKYKTTLKKKTVGLSFDRIQGYILGVLSIKYYICQSNLNAKALPI